MVFVMSNTIPERFRKPIADAVLIWNGALAKVGILDAIQVIPQPSDPNFDADDIRYNVLRWVTEQRPSFGADSQTLYNPLTGEEFRTGVLISADSAVSAANAWRDIVDPVRNGRNTDPVPEQFIHDRFVSEISHETGHNLGMQHNFIGHDAYTREATPRPGVHGEVRHRNNGHGIRAAQHLAQRLRSRFVLSNRAWSVRLLRDEVHICDDSRREDPTR